MARKKLSVDTGVLEIEINGSGVLKMNPSDPNIYNRFFHMRDKLLEIEKRYEKLEALAPDEVDGSGFPLLGEPDPDVPSEAVTVIKALHDIDTEVKTELNYVFGLQNDFDQLLDGVNLMAVANNGERVITNLLNALQPIMVDGAKRQADQKADKAVEFANANRQQRRAARKGGK